MSGEKKHDDYLNILYDMANAGLLGQTEKKETQLQDGSIVKNIIKVDRKKALGMLGRQDKVLTNLKTGFNIGACKVDDSTYVGLSKMDEKAAGIPKNVAGIKKILPSQNSVIMKKILYGDISEQFKQDKAALFVLAKKISGPDFGFKIEENETFIGDISIDPETGNIIQEYPKDMGKIIKTIKEAKDKRQEPSSNREASIKRAGENLRSMIQGDLGRGGKG